MSKTYRIKPVVWKFDPKTNHASAYVGVVEMDVFASDSNLGTTNTFIWILEDAWRFQIDCGESISIEEGKAKCEAAYVRYLEQAILVADTTSADEAERLVAEAGRKDDKIYFLEAKLKWAGEETAEAAKLGLDAQDDVDRLRTENADLKWLAYQCPPNPPVHGGQTWRDWASQLEKTIADATKTDPDLEGIAVSVRKLRAMSAVIDSQARQVAFLTEQAEEANVAATEAGRIGVKALNDGKADRNRLDWLQKRFGEQPWKLVGMIPGTNDVRSAIDASMEVHV